MDNLRNCDPIESIKMLTADQKILLQQTWNYISKDKQQIGIKVFEMIFYLSPDVKRYFRFPDTDFGKGKKKSIDFHSHSLRFMLIIETTLSRLDDKPEELQGLLHNLGIVHCHIKAPSIGHKLSTDRLLSDIPLTFRIHYWAVFTESILFHIRTALEATKRLDKHGIDEAIVVWRILIQAISDSIKEGFLLKRKITGTGASSPFPQRSSHHGTA